jgi:DNA polymerase-3 subunit beta
MMEFSIAKEVLLKGLAKTQSIIEKKNTLPILSNVLIEAKGDGIEILATDLEVGIKGKYEADLKSEGSITVGAKKLFEIVRELPNEKIEIKATDNNWLEIACGNARFKIVGLSSEDFPILQDYEDEQFHTLPAALLSEMIEKVQHAVSLDETRYYLNGVFMQTVEKDEGRFLRMVATDGHRLALMDRELPEGCSLEFADGCIIPRKGINELRKALSEFDDEAKICFKDKNLIVRGEGIQFVIRLIDDDFPEYSQVIPSNNDKKMSCSRDQLFGSLRRVSLVSTDLSKGVKFSAGKKKLEISSSNPDLGEAHEEMVVGYDDTEMSIGFNAKYFLDILNVIKDDDVVIELADELSPGMIKVPSDPGFTAVIMPMRI